MMPSVRQLTHLHSSPGDERNVAVGLVQDCRAVAISSVTETLFTQSRLHDFKMSKMAGKAKGKLKALQKVCPNSGIS